MKFELNSHEKIIPTSSLEIALARCLVGILDLDEIFASTSNLLQNQLSLYERTSTIESKLHLKGMLEINLVIPLALPQWVDWLENPLVKFR